MNEPTKVLSGIKFLEMDIYAIRHQLASGSLDCATFLMVNAYLKFSR